MSSLPWIDLSCCKSFQSKPAVIIFSIVALIYSLYILYEMVSSGTYLLQSKNSLDYKNFYEEYVKTDNPLNRDEESICNRNSDCKVVLTCVNSTCTDLCVGLCQETAVCKVYNHSPYCACPWKTSGNPAYYCFPFDIYIYYPIALSLEVLTIIGEIANIIGLFVNKPFIMMPFLILYPLAIIKVIWFPVVYAILSKTIIIGSGKRFLIAGIKLVYYVIMYMYFKKLKKTNKTENNMPL